jgi:hypothetical protein
MMTAANSPLCSAEVFAAIPDRCRQTDASIPAPHRNSGISRGAPDVPVLPSVIAATSDALASSEAARRPDRSGGGIRSVLAKAHFLAHGMTASSAQPVPLPEDEAKKNCALAPSAPATAAIHFFVRVAENVRKQSLDVVDVFVSVHIPNAATFAFGQENRRHPANMLVGSLAESLRSAGNHFAARSSQAFDFSIGRRGAAAARAASKRLL